MAENENLDLGKSPRLRTVLDVVQKGSSCQEVALRFEKAFIGGLRAAIRQFQKKGVTLADFLKNRDCPHALAQLLRKVGGHDYAPSLPKPLQSADRPRRTAWRAGLMASSTK